MGNRRFTANNIKVQHNLFYGNLHGATSRTTIAKILLQMV